MQNKDNDKLPNQKKPGMPDQGVKMPQSSQVESKDDDQDQEDNQITQRSDKPASRADQSEPRTPK